MNGYLTSKHVAVAVPAPFDLSHRHKRIQEIGQGIGFMALCGLLAGLIASSGSGIGSIDRG